MNEERIAEGGFLLCKVGVGKHCLQSEELLFPRAVGCAENRRKLAQEDMEFLRCGSRMVRAKFEESRFLGEKQSLDGLYTEKCQNGHLEKEKEGNSRSENTPLRPGETAKHVRSISDCGGTRHRFRASDPLPGAGIAGVDGQSAKEKRARLRKMPEREVHLSEVAERVDIAIFQVQCALQGDDALRGLSLAEEGPTERAEDIRSVRLGTVGAAKDIDGPGKLFLLDGNETENEVSHGAFRAECRRPSGGEKSAMHVSHAPFVLRNLLKDRDISGIFREQVL